MTKGRRPPNIKPQRKVTQEAIRIGERQIKINRIVPEAVPTFFCDAMVVQHTPETFFISFLQTQHALAVTSDEQAAIREVDQITQVRIITTPHNLAQNLKAMNDNFNKWVKKTDVKATNAEEFLKEVEIGMKKDVKANGKN